MLGCEHALTDHYRDQILGGNLRPRLDWLSAGLVLTMIEDFQELFGDTRPKHETTSHEIMRDYLPAGSRR